jgi:hypothetical protein
MNNNFWDIQKRSPNLLSHFTIFLSLEEEEQIMCEANSSTLTEFLSLRKKPWLESSSIPEFLVVYTIVLSWKDCLCHSKLKYSASKVAHMYNPTNLEGGGRKITVLGKPGKMKSYLKK